ncbi:MAG TPA: carbohydrate ABC transporter permease, partial [Chloroflexota bacterium]|nr:carbohydrate ABC transporter permease [Chloroflexota bacterium]
MEVSAKLPTPVRSGLWREIIRGGRPRLILTTLVFIPLCLIWIYPFLWMVSAAFKTNDEIFAGPGLIPPSLQLDNFVRAWDQASIGRYFINTSLITLATVAIVLLSTSMIGYVLGRYRFRGKRLIIALFITTVFIPEGYTIIPIFELVNLLHLNNSLWGVILAESGGAHVLFILLFAGFFSQLPKDLEEAAVVDGAGFVRVFWQVMLPLAMPVIATATIMQFLGSWNSFFLPLVLTLSRPEIRTLGVGMFAFQGEYFSDWAGMAAAATISQIPVIAVFVLLQRYFVEG